MSAGLLTQIDRIDDLIYEFYKDFDSAFLKEKPEYRFLLLNALLENLCEFDLGDKMSFNKLVTNLKTPLNPAANKSTEICNGIKSIVGEPTYFAASYWSPIDRKRHTISYSKDKKSKQEIENARASALLFYILTYKAPPIFHSAINYISTTSPRKDGLHSCYVETHPHSEVHIEEQYQIWWHIPLSIHDTLLRESGFLEAIEKLTMYDPDSVENSLKIIMENLDNNAVDDEIKKYEGVFVPILEKAKLYEIPKFLENTVDGFETFLNNFFYPNDAPTVQQNSIDNKLSKKQSFFMACTHALYNKACPTSMFYTFPVRVADTCCILTLGVDKELKLANILAMSHVVKSLYYHGLDRDYQSLNALERNRIAHGAVHKIRGPLNILKEFPYDLEEMLEKTLMPDDFRKLKPVLIPQTNRLKNSIENILLGVKSLENFIEIEQPIKFNLLDTIEKAKKTYNNMNVRIIDKIEINNSIDKNICIYGVNSHIQFIFEELISNSIRAFKFHNVKEENKKLNISIDISCNSSDPIWVVNFIDNGPGIISSKKSSIFFSGIRGSDSGGSGKGLFLSKLFLNKYDGDIVEKGRYGEGANFELTFKKKDCDETKNTNC